MKPDAVSPASKDLGPEPLRTPRFAIGLALVAAAILLVSMRAGGGEAATAPTLGPAASYSVVAGSIVTNTGTTTMSGNLAISPSIGVLPHFTGFPPGIVGPPGVIHDADAAAAAAQADNTAAFTFIDQGCDVTYPGVQDLTLISPIGPGVYCATAFLLTGNLTLAGSGVWIFKSASTLTTLANSSVTGGDPCNVWWRLVSSGTLGTGTRFIGNILALTSISLQTGASLNGRAMAQTGAVTLDNNVISGPTCAVANIPTPIVQGTIPAPAATATQIAALATATQVSAIATATAIAPGGPGGPIPVIPVRPLLPQAPGVPQNQGPPSIFVPQPRPATPQAIAPAPVATMGIPLIVPPRTGDAGLEGAA